MNRMAEHQVFLLTLSGYETPMLQLFVQDIEGDQGSLFYVSGNLHNGMAYSTK